MSNYWTRRVPRRRVMRGAGLTGVGLAGAVLIGCSSDDDGGSGNGGATSTAAATGTSSGSPSPDEAKRGGELILTGGDLQKLDFQATISTPTQWASSTVFSRLIRYDPYSGLNEYAVQGDLAEEWELEEDKVTFHLKKGVKWQNLDPVNGRELVASDIVYSYERLATDDPEYVHAYKLDPVASIEAPDDYTVVFNLKFPTAALLTDLASGQGMGIIPRELVEADGDLNTRWVGSGPFMLDVWEQGNRIRFLKNPDYHKSGYPYVDSIERRFITDTAVNVANFVAGELHFMIVESLEFRDQIERSTDATIRTFPDLGGTHKMYNVREDGPQPEFADLRVRQAFDYALNRNEILDFVFGGDGNIAGPVMPDGYGVWSLPSEEIADLYQENLDEATKLLAAAGHENLKLTFDYSNTSTDSEDEGPIMQQQVARVGIDLELIPSERTVYLQQQVDGTFHLQGIGMSGYPDPSNYLYPTFHSTGSKNYGKVNNPELDALIEKQQSILNEDERIEAVQAIDRDWRSKYLYRTYTAYANAHQAWSSAITGQFTPKGWDYQGLEGVSFV